MVSKTQNETKDFLFILGNGFDLNLGMHTSYRDFGKVYANPLASDSQAVKKLKEYLGVDANTWCDLELKIGESTNIYDIYSEFYYAFCDIGDKLMDYLACEEQKYHSKDNIKKQALAHEFIDDILIFLGNKQILGTQRINIHFITFNYTLVLDRIIETILCDERLSKILADKNVKIFKPYHCHGSLSDKKICFGVDNLKQIRKISIFDNHEDYYKQMMKSHRNMYLRKEDTYRCVEFVKNAGEILIYGCSLGETDRYWINVLKEFLGARWVMFLGPEEELYFPPNIMAVCNKSLYYHSYTAKPISTFDAAGIEFENKIKNKISFKNDERIKIIYENVFKNMKNSLS